MKLNWYKIRTTKTTPKTQLHLALSARAAKLTRGTTTVHGNNILWAEREPNVAETTFRVSLNSVELSPVQELVCSLPLFQTASLFWSLLLCNGVSGLEVNM